MFYSQAWPSASSYLSKVDKPESNKFLIALFAGGRGLNGAVLKPDTLRQMFAPQGSDSDYGLGFASLNVDGIRMVGHRGGVYGFSTESLAIPDEKLGVVVITHGQRC